MPEPEPAQTGSIERRLIGMARWAVLIVALGVQFVSNGGVLFAIGGTPTVELVVYAGLGVLGLGTVVLELRRGSIPRWYRLLGVAGLLTGSVVLSAWLTTDGAERAVHWSLGLIGWYGLVLLFDLRPRWNAAFLGAHALIMAWPVVVRADSVSGIAAMGVGLVSVLGFQFGVALSASLLRGIARQASQTAEQEQAVRIQEEATAAAARNHQRRYAELHQATIPLLTGLASGDADPRDPAVRRRCAVEAARMRRLFSEHDDTDDRLVHELAAIIDVAERHGVSVRLTVRGTPAELPEHVRRGLLGPISEALVTAGTDARVTVLHGPDRVRVSVRCQAAGSGTDDEPNPAGQHTAGQHLGGQELAGVHLVESVHEGTRWLETSWQSR